MPSKLTKETFIKKANNIYKNKYDYSKVNYINTNTKVCITCPEHGDFLQTPHNHLQGQRCPECGKIVKSEKKSSNTKEFIEKARKIHGDKYDYSKVEYINNHTKVCIICPVHGEFWQSANSHLQGCSCAKCSERHNYTTQEFIEKAKKIHDNKYDYSKTIYTSNYNKVCIICNEKDEFGKEHGHFYISAKQHLKGGGCTKCNKKYHWATKEWNKEASRIHNNKYDYSKVEYVNTITKVCIICPIHGKFWQRPFEHLSGKGCPKCNSSHLERKIRIFLTENKIKFEEQKTFDWLKYKNNLYLDFYLPEYNIGIECQGEQHFKPVDFSSGNQTNEKINNIFLHIQQRDYVKFKLCTKNNIKIFYYSELGINYPYEVYEDKIKMLNDIKNGINETKSNVII